MNKLGAAGLVVLALATAGGVAGAFANNEAPAPVPGQVQSYYEAHATKPTLRSPTPRPVIAFIGDSYTQGVGASAKGTRWAEQVAASLGMYAENLGRGGTGYVTVAGKNGCGLDVCPNYLQMVPQVIKIKPTTVVVAGGQNDFQAFAKDSASVTAAVENTFTDLRAALPNTKIVAVGPSTPWTVDASVVAFDLAVQRAARKVDATYVSLIEPNVITKDVILKDGAHVNDVGHKALAERVLTAFR
ncbi:SGNH/GDSL hydrolase family protein [Arthrobacter sp. MAHUQ-56]